MQFVLWQPLHQRSWISRRKGSSRTIFTEEWRPWSEFMCLSSANCLWSCSCLLCPATRANSVIDSRCNLPFIVDWTVCNCRFLRKNDCRRLGCPFSALRPQGTYRICLSIVPCLLIDASFPLSFFSPSFPLFSFAMHVYLHLPSLLM